MQPPPELEPQAGQSRWTRLSTFMADEGLAADDIVRLIEMAIAPLMETVNGLVWVYRPSIIDWRPLARTLGFKPLRELHMTAAPEPTN